MQWITSLICLAIALRLLAFQRQGAPHNRWAAVVAYVVISVCFSVLMLAIFDRVPPPEQVTALFGFMILMALLRSRGNIMIFIPTLDELKNRRKHGKRGKDGQNSYNR
ncbi:hypothetical protein BIY27_11460 [Gibbsiella quercinecans]|uniref:phage holin family protein n=1 Tax=Gibbsiella quercinecans TaxID=929813 RepID=UPI000EF1EF79|nr:phage holin family protein [Gibbsiella quercinecans]RLM12574.1 hypothetical protein BIY27_11460 [Gibbsiella quercinecans]